MPWIWVPMKKGAIVTRAPQEKTVIHPWKKLMKRGHHGART